MFLPLPAILYSVLFTLYTSAMYPQWEVMQLIYELLILVF